MYEKAAIRIVGVLEARGPGEIYVSGWRFNLNFPWLPQDDYELPLSDLGAAGWSWAELHAIAHGVPCDCEVLRLLRIKNLA